MTCITVCMSSDLGLFLGGFVMKTNNFRDEGDNNNKDYLKNEDDLTNKYQL